MNDQDNPCPGLPIAVTMFLGLVIAAFIVGVVIGIGLICYAKFIGIVL